MAAAGYVPGEVQLVTICRVAGAAGVEAQGHIQDDCMTAPRCGPSPSLLSTLHQGPPSWPGHTTSLPRRAGVGGVAGRSWAGARFRSACCCVETAVSPWCACSASRCVPQGWRCASVCAYPQAVVLQCVAGAARSTRVRGSGQVAVPVGADHMLMGVALDQIAHCVTQHGNFDTRCTAGCLSFSIIDDQEECLTTTSHGWSHGLVKYSSTAISTVVMSRDAVVGSETATKCHDRIAMKREKKQHWRYPHQHCSTCNEAFQTLTTA